MGTFDKWIVSGDCKERSLDENLKDVEKKITILKELEEDRKNINNKMEFLKELKLKEEEKLIFNSIPSNISELLVCAYGK